MKSSYPGSNTTALIRARPRDCRSNHEAGQPIRLGLMQAYRIQLIFVLVAMGMPASDLPADQLRATELRCNQLENPSGLGVANPQFSWRIADPSGERGQRQTAYEIVVSSSREALQRDSGDLWTSGWVHFDQSISIAYDGAALRSNQECFWKVRLRDKSGSTGPWSEAARFTTGILRAEDWVGRWIHHPSAPSESHIWYRRTFELGAAKQAWVHIGSVGYHELYINGKKVDDRVLAPALSRIDRQVYYVTYDVRPLLRDGPNTIAIWYGPGWTRNDFFSRKVKPAVYGQLNAELANGKRVSVATDEDWRCAISNRKNTGFSRHKDHGAEWVDARGEVPDWNQVGFDDRSWPKAEVIEVPATLSPHALPPSRVIRKLQPQVITLLDDAMVKIDLGLNFTGFLRIAFADMQAGDEVKIMVSDGLDSLQDFGQCSVYICRGVDGETFENRFNYSAGRYVTLQGISSPDQILKIEGEVVATDLERIGEFQCSNDLFNRIYETDLWTFQTCTTEGFTADCPHRERMGYGEVAFATSWGIGLPSFETGAFYRKIVQDWEDVQEENGWIHHTAPQWNRHWGGPLWSSAGINVAWEHYLHFGDVSILRDHYASHRAWLEFLHTKSPTGLLEPYAERGWYLGDWAAPWGRREFGDKQAAYFNNCVYALVLEKMIQIALVLDQVDDARDYEARRETLKRRINDTYLDHPSSRYMEGNQVQTAFALLAGIVPPSRIGDSEDHLARSLEADDAYLDMGSSGLPVLLNYLTTHPRYDEAVNRILSKVTEPGYGYFLAKGETTWPEHWSSDVESRMHTCYTGISSWFVKRVLGIRANPAVAGYRSILLEPAFLRDLSHAHGQAATPYGPVTSAWSKSDDLVTWKIILPIGTTAEVRIPAHDENLVLESGGPLQAAVGVTRNGFGRGKLELKLEAGAYHFEFPISPNLR